MQGRRGASKIGSIRGNISIGSNIGHGGGFITSDPTTPDCRAGIRGNLGHSCTCRKDQIRDGFTKKVAVLLDFVQNEGKGGGGAANFFATFS